jgi:hypothetical protein
VHRAWLLLRGGSRRLRSRELRRRPGHPGFFAALEEVFACASAPAGADSLPPLAGSFGRARTRALRLCGHPPRRAPRAWRRGGGVVCRFLYYLCGDDALSSTNFAKSSTHLNPVRRSSLPRSPVSPVVERSPKPSHTTGDVLRSGGRKIRELSGDLHAAGSRSPSSRGGSGEGRPCASRRVRGRCAGGVFCGSAPNAQAPCPSAQARPRTATLPAKEKPRPPEMQESGAGARSPNDQRSDPIRPADAARTAGCRRVARTCALAAYRSGEAPGRSSRCRRRPSPRRR